MPFPNQADEPILSRMFRIAQPISVCIHLLLDWFVATDDTDLLDPGQEQYVYAPQNH
jgi:hypothetical protein